MPIAAFVPAIIGAGASIGGAAMATRAQTGASKRATKLQGDSDQRAMQLEQLQLDEDRRRWDAEQRNLAEQQDYSRRWQEDDRAFTRQMYADREARLQPYRQVSGQALGRLSSLIGLDGGPGGGGVWRSPSQMGRMSDLVRR